MFSTYLLNFAVLLIILSLNSVHPAPVDEKKSLFDIVSDDSRAAQLKSENFVKPECSKKNEFSDSLCLALYDISLKFHEAQLPFEKSENDNDKEICSKLDSILPDKPTLDEATLEKIRKSYASNITWIKDVVKSKDGKRCRDECIYDDFTDYQTKVKPVCFFIFNQYQFLASQSTSKQESTAFKSGEETKSAENNGKTDSKALLSVTQESVKDVQEAFSAFQPIMPANLVEVPKASNESQPQLSPPVQQQPPFSAQSAASQQLAKSSEIANEAKKEEKTSVPVASVTVNKSETAQAKAGTPKTESTINSVDLDGQDNLEDSNNKEVFGENEETQSEFPEKEIDVNLGANPDEDDDMDGDYSPDLVRDNNHNAGNQKFSHDPSTDVEPHESEQSRVKVEKIYDEFEDNPDSNFFTYLCIVMFLSILLYILYHNRHKILALFLEGRRGSRRPRERSRGGSKAAYSKLDCNLEEAITSKKSLGGKSMDIIY